MTASSKVGIRLTSSPYNRFGRGKICALGDLEDLLAAEDEPALPLEVPVGHDGEQGPEDLPTVSL